jgi:hypothetical protein
VEAVLGSLGFGVFWYRLGLSTATFTESHKNVMSQLTRDSLPQLLASNTFNTTNTIINTLIFIQPPLN